MSISLLEPWTIKRRLQKLKWQFVKRMNFEASTRKKWNHTFRPNLCTHIVLMISMPNREILRSNCLILVKVNIKWSRLDYNNELGAYLGIYDLISPMALLPMTVRVIFKVKGYFLRSKSMHLVLYFFAN